MSRYLSETGGRGGERAAGCLMPPLGDQGSAGRGGPLGLCQTAGCHVFLTQIRNGEQKAYVLKNKELTGPTKGLIFLEADVIFNSVSRALDVVSIVVVFSSRRRSNAIITDA